MANILVTGGAGFIGSHLTNRLMSLGHNVMVVDNLSTGSLRNVPKNVIFVNADISNLDRLSCVFNSCSFDFIYHLAAQTNLRKSFTDSVFDAQTNIIGMLNLLKISPFIMNPQGKFIFVSTGGAIYSPDAPLPWTEQSNTFPPSPYGISKLSAEHYVTQLTNNNCIFRLANVYGPRQNSKSEAGVISIFINKLLNGKDPIIFGDGEQTRDFIYVQDVVDALLLGLDPEATGIFNVSSNQGTSINQIGKIITDQMRLDSIISHSDPIPGELQHSVLDNSKIKSFGWEPRVPLESGIASTINYFSDI